MSIVRLDSRPGYAASGRPHLRRVRGQWVVLIRVPAPARVFEAMSWCDWKNGRHDWYYRGSK